MKNSRFPVSPCPLQCHHLEISPSPFKWEVSGRALRTVSAGGPDQKVTRSEWEQGCALGLQTFTHRSSIPPTSFSLPVLPALILPTTTSVTTTTSNSSNRLSPL